MKLEVDSTAFFFKIGKWQIKYILRQLPSGFVDLFNNTSRDKNKKSLERLVEKCNLFSIG